MIRLFRDSLKRWNIQPVFPFLNKVPFALPTAISIVSILLFSIFYASVQWNEAWVVFFVFVLLLVGWVLGVRYLHPVLFFFATLMFYFFLRVVVTPVKPMEKSFWIRGTVQESLYYNVLSPADSTGNRDFRFYPPVLLIPPFPEFSNGQLYLMQLQPIHHFPGTHPGFPSWNSIRLREKTPLVARVMRWYPLNDQAKPSATARGRLEWVRGYIRNQLNRFPTPLNGLLQAMILGEKTSLHPLLKRWFQSAGIQHLLALSGLHLGIILFLVSLAMEFLPVPRSVRLLFLMGFLVFYLALTGWKISLLRAAGMGMLWYFASHHFQTMHRLHPFTLTLFLFLVLDPLILFQISFQFTFLATLAILHYSHIRSRLMPERIQSFRILRTIFDLFMITLMIYLYLSPLQFFHFRELTLAGMVFNLWCIPLFSLILTGAFIFLLFSPLPFISAMILKSISFLFSLYLLLMPHFFRTIPDSPIRPELLPTVIICVLSIIVLERGFNSRLFIYSLISSVLLYGLINVSKPATRLIIFDVNQANAFLIQHQGKNILIDAGRDLRIKNRYYSLPQILNKMGIRKLDAVFITHTDRDHAGQLLPVSEYISKGTIYSAEQLPTLPSEIVRQGDVISLAPDLKFLILSPDSQLIRGSADRNDLSLVMKCFIGGKTVLITGDVGESVLSALSREVPVLQSDFLMYPHHGSSHSFSRTFLEAVQPQLVIFSAGYNNPYGHPAPEILDYLQQSRIPMLLTASHGTIEISF